MRKIFIYLSFLFISTSSFAQMTDADYLVAAANNIKNNNSGEALRMLDKAINYNDTCAQCLFMRSEVYLKNNRHGEALTDAKKLNDLFPLKPNFVRQLGLIYFEIREYQPAQDDLAFYLTYYPKDVDIHLKKGISEGKLTDVASAEDDFEQAETLSNHSKSVVFKVAKARFDLGDYETSIKDLNELIDNDENIDYLLLKAECLLKLEKIDDAINEYNKVIKKDPNNAIAFNEKGEAESVMGDFQLAIKSFNKAVELNPKFAEAFLNRAIVYGETNKKKLAIDDLSKAMSLNAELAHPRIISGIDHMLEGRDDMACEEWKKITNKELAHANAAQLIKSFCKETK